MAMWDHVVGTRDLIACRYTLAHKEVEPSEAYKAITPSAPGG
jgi:hypothetical protein